MALHSTVQIQWESRLCPAAEGALQARVSQPESKLSHRTSKIWQRASRGSEGHFLPTQSGRGVSSLIKSGQNERKPNY